MLAIILREIEMLKTKSILILLLFPVITFAQSSIKMTGENSYVKRTHTQNNEKFTFAILGDKTNGGELNWPIFDRAVEEINLLQPDFVIMVGDMIQGVTTDLKLIDNMWKEFQNHAEKLKVPLYLLPGNHDISNEVMYNYWNKNIGLRYYSFVHKNTLFILLNSEEYQKDKTGQLGSAQLEFIQAQLDENPKVNETFIFLHRPIWYKSDSRHGGYDEWQKINSWIRNRRATVFAGHWHNLVYKKIEGKRHIVLSATGGNLEEKQLPELGYFHHYSLVTVDKDTSFISFIKPGSIFPEGIANENFLSKFKKLVKVNNSMNVDEDIIRLSSQIRFHNLLNKNVEYTLRINNKENPFWKFDKNVIIKNLKINEEYEYKFFSENSVKKSVPFPIIEYSISIDGKLAETESFSFAPNNDVSWRFPKKVKILGGFDLKISGKPMNEKDIVNTQISPEVGIIDDEIFISKIIDDNQSWKKVHVTDGKIILDNHFERIDFAVGYIKFIIDSKEDKNVIASLKPDNFAKVYHNREVVLNGSPYRGVPNNPYMFLLSLKKGENNILIKTANYYGSWYITFKVSDPKNKLIFKIRE